MSEGAGGTVTGGKFKPFKGQGTFSNFGNAIADEGVQDLDTMKNQVGLGNKPKPPPQNLPQTKKLQQIQSNTEQTQKDQEEIKRLTKEIYKIAAEHRQGVFDWDKELLEHDQIEKQEKEKQERDEAQLKLQQEQEKLKSPVALPGSANKMPGLFKQKKSSFDLNEAQRQAVNKDYRANAKG